MFGLAAIAAVAAMAFIGASSASATSTALCKVNEDPCAAGNQLSSLHMTNTAGTLGELLAIGGIELTVLCLNILAQAEVLALGSPLSVHTKELNLTNCGTNAGHNNCTVNTAIKLPLFDLLKTGANLGQLTALSGEALVRCVIAGIIVIDCTYNGTGLSFTVEGALHSGAGTGHGMLTSNGTELPLASGGGLCPEKSIIHGLLEPLTHTWISS